MNLQETMATPRRRPRGLSPPPIDKSPTLAERIRALQQAQRPSNESKMPLHTVKPLPSRRQKKPKEAPAFLQKLTTPKEVEWPETDSWAKWPDENDERIPSDKENSVQSPSHQHISPRQQLLVGDNRSERLTGSKSATSSAGISESMFSGTIDRKIDGFLATISKLAPPDGASKTEADEFNQITSLAASVRTNGVPKKSSGGRHLSPIRLQSPEAVRSPSRTDAGTSARERKSSRSGSKEKSPLTNAKIRSTTNPQRQETWEMPITTRRENATQPTRGTTKSLTAMWESTLSPTAGPEISYFSKKKEPVNQSRGDRKGVIRKMDFSSGVSSSRLEDDDRAWTPQKSPLKAAPTTNSRQQENLDEYDDQINQRNMQSKEDAWRQQVESPLRENGNHFQDSIMSVDSGSPIESVYESFVLSRRSKEMGRKSGQFSEKSATDEIKSEKTSGDPSSGVKSKKLHVSFSSRDGTEKVKALWSHRPDTKKQEGGKISPTRERVESFEREVDGRSERSPVRHPKSKKSPAKRTSWKHHRRSDVAVCDELSTTSSEDFTESLKNQAFAEFDKDEDSIRDMLKSDGFLGESDTSFLRDSSSKSPLLFESTDEKGNGVRGETSGNRSKSMHVSFSPRNGSMAAESFLSPRPYAQGSQGISSAPKTNNVLFERDTKERRGSSPIRSQPYTKGNQGISSPPKSNIERFEEDMKGSRRSSPIRSGGGSKTVSGANDPSRTSWKHHRRSDVAVCDEPSTSSSEDFTENPKKQARAESKKDQDYIRGMLTSEGFLDASDTLFLRESSSRSPLLFESTDEKANALRGDSSGNRSKGYHVSFSPRNGTRTAESLIRPRPYKQGSQGISSPPKSNIERFEEDTKGSRRSSPIRSGGGSKTVSGANDPSRTSWKHHRRSDVAVCDEPSTSSSVDFTENPKKQARAESKKDQDYIHGMLKAEGFLDASDTSFLRESSSRSPLLFDSTHYLPSANGSKQPLVAFSPRNGASTVKSLSTPRPGTKGSIGKTSPTGANSESSERHTKRSKGSTNRTSWKHHRRSDVAVCDEPSTASSEDFTENLKNQPFAESRNDQDTIRGMLKSEGFLGESDTSLLRNNSWRSLLLLEGTPERENGISRRDRTTDLSNSSGTRAGDEGIFDLLNARTKGKERQTGDEKRGTSLSPVRREGGIKKDLGTDNAKRTRSKRYRRSDVAVCDDLSMASEEDNIERLKSRALAQLNDDKDTINDLLKPRGPQSESRDISLRVSKRWTPHLEVTRAEPSRERRRIPSDFTLGGELDSFEDFTQNIKKQAFEEVEKDQREILELLNLKDVKVAEDTSKADIYTEPDHLNESPFLSGEKGMANTKPSKQYHASSDEAYFPSREIHDPFQGRALSAGISKVHQSVQLSTADQALIGNIYPPVASQNNFSSFHSSGLYRLQQTEDPSSDLNQGRLDHIRKQYPASHGVSTGFNSTRMRGVTPTVQAFVNQTPSGGSNQVPSGLYGSSSSDLDRLKPSTSSGSGRHKSTPALPCNPKHGYWQSYSDVKTRGSFDSTLVGEEQKRLCGTQGTCSSPPERERKGELTFADYSAAIAEGERRGRLDPRVVSSNGNFGIGTQGQYPVANASPHLYPASNPSDLFEGLSASVTGPTADPTPNGANGIFQGNAPYSLPAIDSNQSGFCGSQQAYSMPTKTPRHAERANMFQDNDFGDMSREGIPLPHPESEITMFSASQKGRSDQKYGPNQQSFPTMSEQQGHNAEGMHQPVANGLRYMMGSLMSGGTKEEQTVDDHTMESLTMDGYTKADDDDDATEANNNCSLICGDCDFRIKGIPWFC